MSETKDTVDVLAFGAHPDDVELSAGGTLLRAREAGLTVAVCHLTKGEAGTRGDPQTRAQEAAQAGAVLGVRHVDQLDLGDGGLHDDDKSRMAVADAIRRRRPRTVLAPHLDDLHPDHAATGSIVKAAAFLSGVRKWNPGQSAWRPDAIFYYMMHTPFEPDIVVDITSVFESRRRAVECYASQFHNPNSTEPHTFISDENFWHWWEGRAAYFGHFIGVRYGEPLRFDGPLPTSNPFSLFGGFGKYKNT